jgi:hypothetical protein
MEPDPVRRGSFDHYAAMVGRLAQGYVRPLSQRALKPTAAAD